MVWKSKMADSEEQLRLVRYVCSSVCKPVFFFFFLLQRKKKRKEISIISMFQALEKVSKMEAENQSVEQVGMFVSIHLSVASRVSGGHMHQCHSHRHLCFYAQLKAQMMLLEAQLEKQSDHQGAMEELEQVHKLLRATIEISQILSVKTGPRPTSGEMPLQTMRKPHYWFYIKI